MIAICSLSVETSISLKADSLITKLLCAEPGGGDRLETYSYRRGEGGGKGGLGGRGGGGGGTYTVQTAAGSFPLDLFGFWDLNGLE